MQVLVGYLIPIAFLLADETVSRKSFEFRYNLGTAFSNRGMALCLQHLMLVPLGAALLFHSFVFLLNYLNM